MKQTGKQGQKKIWLIIAVACLMVCLMTVAVISIRWIRSQRIRKEEWCARKTAMEATQADGAKPLLYFEDLIKQNSDIVGLVSFGENMSLYVCQTDNNHYYMTHRFDRSEDPAGMIFLDCRCSTFPQSENMILYGHNMKDGSRFGTLKRFAVPELLRKYPDVTYTSLYETQVYTPFAVFYTSTNPESTLYFDYARIVFSNAEDYNDYVTEVKRRSVVNVDVETSYGDRLLTMVTCSNETEEGQLVVVCVMKNI